MRRKTRLRDSILRARRQIGDALRNSRIVWELSAAEALARSFVARTPENRLVLRATAYRRTNLRFLREHLERRLSPWLQPPRANIWRLKKIGWKRFRDQVSRKALDKSIILKSPAPDGEKGVFYVSFENNWLRLTEHYDLPKLLEEYFLVVAS